VNPDILERTRGYPQIYETALRQVNIEAFIASGRAG